MESILIYIFMVVVCFFEGVATASIRRQRWKNEALQQLLDEANEALDKLNAWSVEYEMAMNAKVTNLEERQNSTLEWMQLIGDELKVLERDKAPADTAAAPAGEDIDVPATEDVTTITLVEGFNVEDMTRDQLKTVLDQMGISYRQKATKAELIAQITEGA